MSTTTDPSRRISGEVLPAAGDWGPAPTPRSDVRHMRSRSRK